ncbi:MAG: acetylglutamate kinase [Chlorobi bacterium]|nr:acetylglutamate kinase [Chlorobiota bacterium]
MTSLHVLKIGGELLSTDEQIRTIARRIALLPQPLVIVHGGGRQTTELAARLGIETRFHNGRRITDEATLEVLVMTIAGAINKRFVAALLAAGVRAVGISALDGGTIRSMQRTGEISFGLVGDPVHSDASLLLSLLERGFTLVAAPITHDGWGHLLNTNADTIAATIAVMLAVHGHSVELSLCTPSGGVRNSDGQIMLQLDRAGYAALVERGIARDGILPKIDAALSAAECGVDVAIISAETLPHRFGTRIVAQQEVTR